MNKIFHGFICSLFFLTAYAQNIPCKLQKSEVFEDKYKYSHIISVDEDDEGGVVVVRFYQGGLLHLASSGYYFEHYNKDLKLIKEYEYVPEGRGDILGITVQGSKVNIIDFIYNKEDKAYVCSANTASLSDFKFTHQELFRLKRDEVKRNTNAFYGQFAGYEKDGRVTMLINQDKTAFGISIHMNDKEEHNKVHKIYVYDFDLNLKIDHTFKRDIRDRKFQYENIDVSADGNVVYLLGKVFTEEAKEKEQGGKYEYELTRITKDDSKTQAFNIQEHYATSLKVIIKQEKIACVGFYSDRKDYRFKGLCYFDMDPVSLDITTSKFTPFTEQFIIDKYGKDKDKELKDIIFRDMFLADNGDIVFNAEEHYVTVSHNIGLNGSMGMGMGQVNYFFHYDDIVSARISNSGELLWARNINKRQSTDGSNAYVSYSSMVKGDNTFFFINTADKVKRLKNERIQFNQKSPNRSNLNVIRIAQNGDFDYQMLLSDDDNEVPFMVMMGAASKQSNALYFIGRKGKKKQLLKIAVE